MDSPSNGRKPARYLCLSRQSHAPQNRLDPRRAGIVSQLLEQTGNHHCQNSGACIAGLEIEPVWPAICLSLTWYSIVQES